MKQKTKISVGVITYNQETTIRQTLDSILTQKGDFDLEVIIGEDCSPDGTYAICKDYVRQVESGKWKVEGYERTIVLLPNTKNLGIMANFARVMKACTGEYVGICAGDDYWCDEHKLQKQLEYFRMHPDVGVVSTSGYRHYVLRDEMVQGIAPLHPIMDGDIKNFYFSTNYKGGVYAMPLSLLIKRDVMKYVDFDEFVKRGFPVEDYPMQAVMAQHCKWGHINDLCVVYRVYKESATFISYDHPKYLQYHKGLMNIRHYLNELFPNDACFSEEWMQEYEFYKEFLLYLHKGDYRKAKQLVSQASEIIHSMRQYKQANNAVKSWLYFTIFRWYKWYRNRKELKNRTRMY